MILVKPQFELPKGKLREAAMRGEAHGQRAALERVQTKATELGFVLLGYTPSPVAGGEGTVEILSAWRFDGLTREPHTQEKSLDRTQPAQGKKPPLPSSRKSRQVPSEWTLFAVAAPGLEEVVETELRNLGMQGVTRVVGGVEWRGGEEAVWQANLWLRSASRPA